ncbi:MAG: signal recognition particle-docking protein FtsY, partial [Planctomycetota bacterium]
MVWNPFSRKKAEEPQAPETSTPKTDIAESTSSSEAPMAADLTSVAEDSVATESSQTSESEKPKGLFGRLRGALKNTVQFLNTDIRDLVGKEGRLVDDEFLDELFAILVKTDMGNKTAMKIRDEIGARFRARKLMLEDLISSAKETIREIMVQEDEGISMAAEGPTVIMVVGVNGSGKTTSIAKLANLFIKDGKKVVLGAGDTFRAAAVGQLTIWAERLGAEIVTGREKSDPASVAYKAVDAAKNSQADVCIVDTAGRLQTQSNLMDELARIRKVISKVIPDAPHEVLLVLDSTAGQNAISQAKGFTEVADCNGIVLAKLDGSAKGGVAIPIRQEFGLPVKFVGLGESPDDLA